MSYAVLGVKLLNIKTYTHPITILSYHGVNAESTGTGLKVHSWGRGVLGSMVENISQYTPGQHLSPWRA